MTDEDQPLPIPSTPEQVKTQPSHEIMTILSHQPPFAAGAISRHFDAWTRLTSDRHILDIVKGFTLDLTAVPQQLYYPKQLLTKTDEISI